MIKKLLLFLGYWIPVLGAVAMLIVGWIFLSRFLFVRWMYLLIGVGFVLQFIGLVTKGLEPWKKIGNGK